MNDLFYNIETLGADCTESWVFAIGLKVRHCTANSQVEFGNNSATTTQRKESVQNIFLKPHLRGRVFCNEFEDILRVKFSLAEWLLTRSETRLRDRVGKNRRHVSNTSDLRCRLYFARLDARIVVARDHLHEIDFNVSRVLGQSRAHVNRKSYAV